MLALVDCNNFFVSCEKVFQPKLEGKPVVVLSSNDGCVVARSQEAKKLGIAMGEPAFQCEALFKKYGVQVLSSNFALYLDMSERVMEILHMHAAHIEVYSIDEAFILLEGDPVAQAKAIKGQILKWTGLPVSIGIASTKTLAKAANHYAKKEGVTYIDETNRQSYLERLPVEEIWGIGRRLGARLQRQEIYNSWQLACCPDAWLKKELSVVGLRLAWELRGTPCLELEEIHGPKKSISTAKSFEKRLFKLDELLAILADYTAHVAEKLRQQGSLASLLVVTASGPDCYDSASFVLPEPTSYTPTLIQHAKGLLKRIFREGYGYKEVGVLLGNFSSPESVALDLFCASSTKRRQKELKAMQVLDRANERWGKKTLYFASQKPRTVRKNYCTPRYTTSWDELLLISL